MAIYTIADTHLSLAVDKPMDIFGSRWENYLEKLTNGWTSTVAKEDTVVIPGDISWAMNLEEALDDFLFLDSLPGKKLLGKGNHDYWWTSLTRMKAFFEENGISTLDFLYNNAYACEDINICGCRGWYVDKNNSPKNTDFNKIVSREAARLELSLSAADRLNEESGENRENVVFMHFPPLFINYKCEELLDVMHRHGVKLCFYGHIHGQYDLAQVVEEEGIEFVLISGDYLDFIPQRVN
ncbi:MAG: serine/threonine protein phosphatase [Clostridiales bacterium]|jgi:predicted phosphohydrolase|nr:serine/threonine protein phosphatase [Clostridiales bacterium]